MFGSSAVSKEQLNPNGDIVVGESPKDCISCLEWSPKSNHLVAGCWDASVSCWEVSPQGQSQPKARNTFDAPVLCTAWAADGSKVYVGGCSNKVMAWDLGSNQKTQVAAHAAPVKEAAFVPELGGGCLVTASWDKTVKFWDTRQANPMHTINVPDKVWCMDVRHPVLAIGTANRRVQIYNLQQPQQVFKDIESPLNNQSRTIAVFPDQKGFALGSTEGRVAIQHLNDADKSKNFAFKCHRNTQPRVPEIYAVNSIRFHPTFGTFSTAGADGSYHFWDKDSKQRLKQMQRSCAPVSCTAFNNTGTIFAYAISYDWSKGAQGAELPQHKTHTILLHGVQEAEVKPRSRAAR